MKDKEILEDNSENAILTHEQQKKMKQKEIGKKVFDLTKFYFILVVLSFIRAIFTYVFIIPNGFAPGGLTGMSSIIYNAVLPFNPQLANTVFSPSVTAMVLNIPLLIAGFILLNKKFALNTFLCVAVFSGFMAVFEQTGFPQYTVAGDSGVSLLAALTGGAGCGIALGFMLRMNMSMGGTDVIGKIIYKYNSTTDVQWWIFACDCVIVLASGGLGFIGLDLQNSTPTHIATQILSPIIYSFISLIATSEVADVIQSGMQSNRVFTIISSKYEDIAEEIATTMGRGVTVTEAKGYYTGNTQHVLNVVVSNKQVNIVKSIVTKHDPNAFAYITKTNEVNGNGFRLKSYE